MKPFKLSAIALALMATSMGGMAADQRTTSRMATAVVTAGRGADECRYILHTDKIIAFKRLLGLRFTQQDVDYATNLYGNTVRPTLGANLCYGEALALKAI
jgi:hypothetical protein